MDNESTYESILNRALSIVPEDVDKREGGIIYTTLSPVCMELARSYWLLGYLLDLIMPDTSEGEWLSKITEQFGVIRQTATNAVRIIKCYNDQNTPFEIPVGSRFRIYDITLKTIEMIETGVYKANVEQSGSIGNKYQGELLTIQNINDLGMAILSDEILIEAQDVESDSELRKRFYDHVRRTPFGGNVSDYEEKVLSIDGVGAVKVFPIWNGPGTVFLLIGNESGRSASSDLVKKVQDTFQPAEDSFSGLAPIGHIVSTGTSTDLAIDISATLVISSGSSMAILQEKIEKEIKTHIDLISFRDIAVYRAKLMAVILNVEGVIDVQILTINGKSENLVLSKTSENYQTTIMGQIILSKV